MTKTILVIDDSETIRRAAAKFLSGLGVRVVHAVDGFEAFAAVLKERPNLILVDVMMPRVDGFGFCKQVKRHRDLAATPVLMLTSKDGPIDKARGNLAGADGYLIKPFNRDQLIAALIRHSLISSPAAAPQAAA
jgi:twitching motility two-component system response regulator PilG